MSDLTKRELLAGMAMQALISNVGANGAATWLHKRAVNHADALLAELEMSAPKTQIADLLDVPWTCSKCGHETRNKHGYCDPCIYVNKPVADNDGWIAHKPGDPMPCKGNLRVDVRFRDGNEHSGKKARYWEGDASCWDVDLNHRNLEIIAWRPAR